MTLDDLSGRAFITIEDFATLPGSPSRGVCYEAARQGTIPVRRLGRRLLIPVPELLQWLGVPTSSEEAGP